MSDTLTGQNWPSNERIIRKMQQQIDENIGENVWNKLTGGDAPASHMSDVELSKATGTLILNFDRIADGDMANKVFS